MTEVRQLLRAARERLLAAGVESARWESEQLLAERLATSTNQLQREPDRQIPDEIARDFERLIDRRAAREPLQHLLGHWPFLELDLLCDRRALIPRPETEDVALATRALLADDRPTRVVDVGTGCGCLALALAASHRQAQIVAIDSSPAALELAQENAQRSGLAARVQFICGSLLEPLVPTTPFDLIVANLPYVRYDEWPLLQPEVRDHDPLQALVAAQDGLALILELARAAVDRLIPGGWLVLEHAPDQAEVLRRSITPPVWSVVETHLDRYERARFTIAQR